MRRYMKRAGWWIVILCCALCVLLISLVVQRARGAKLPLVCGWGMAVVVTGSMEPEIPTGALVLVHKQESYSVGDVICFSDAGENMVMHRVIALDALEQGIIQTQGDANNTADDPIAADQILGRVAAVSPAAGYLVIWIKSHVPEMLFCGGIFLVAGYMAKKLLKRKVQKPGI